MPFSNLGIWLGNVSLAEINYFTKDPMKAQKATLKKILRRNKNCVLGKKYHFKDIQSIEDFQKNVPLSTYADYEPYIEKMLAGDKTKYMFSGINVRYASSSGSVGKPKILPKGVNDLWKMQCIGFSGSVAVAAKWIKEHKGEKLYSQIGPLALNLSGHKTDDGRQCNGAGQIPLRYLKPITKFICTSPVSLLYPNLEDKLDTSYLHLRFALENREVSYLGSMVVTLLTTMFDYLEENWEMLCDDIALGRINPNIDIPDSMRKQYEKKLKPNPERAAELRKEFEKGFDDPIAPRIWPKLQWAYGMMGSNLSVYVDKLRKFIGDDVPIHNMGYAAAEGFFAAPMELNVQDYVLLPWCLFFEFLPINEDGETVDDTKPLLINELEIGKNYELVVTNFSGLYRYRTEDVVNVTRMYNNTPQIEFLFRQNLSMNVANEKTTTEMVIAAATGAAKEMGVEYQGFSFYPDFSTKPPRYTMLAELKDGAVDEDGRQKFIDTIDHLLDGINEKYYKYRRWGMLNRPEILFLKPKTYADYNKYLSDKGVVLNQIKPVTVINNADREQFFFSHVETKADVVDEVLAKFQ